MKRYEKYKDSGVVWLCLRKNTMGDKVTIQNGFPDEMRSSAAQLYDAAFEAKLSIAILIDTGASINGGNP